MYTEINKMGIKDIDKDLKIINKSVLEMLENIAVYHADSLNRGPQATYKEGFAWVLSDWKVKVISRPQYGEKLVINTWRRDSKKFHTYRDFEIYNSNGDLKIIATSKWVMFNFETGKLMKIDEEVEKWNEKEDEKSVFEDRKIEKITLPTNYEKSIEYTVMRKDIDVNEHMHNLSYLDLAYEVLPDDIYTNKIFDNIHINYKKQIKLYDEIKCKYSKMENKVIVVITNKDESITHAIVELY